MGPFVSMDVSESGLTAYRLQMDVVASNLANVESSVTPGGTPYRPMKVVMRPGPSFPQALAGAVQGVEVSAIVPAPLPPAPVAGTQGTASTPSSVDVVSAMSDLIAASRSYDANVSAYTVEKAVFQRALSLGQNA